MRRILICLIAFAIGATRALAVDSATPHDMLLANGEADTDKCGLCHEQDMSLSRSKLETCTLCHATTVHSGANEHVGAELDQQLEVQRPQIRGDHAVSIGSRPDELVPEGVTNNSARRLNPRRLCPWPSAPPARWP